MPPDTLNHAHAMALLLKKRPDAFIGGPGAEDECKTPGFDRNATVLMEILLASGECKLQEDDSS